MRFEERHIDPPAPETLTDGQVMLRVTAAGICGSDLPAVRGDGLTLGLGDPVPGYPIHEVAGTVLATRAPGLPVGSSVVGWAAGWNGLAEVIVCSGAELVAYDAAHWTPAEAIVVQPLACILYAVDQIGPVAGLSVAVLGQGSIGVLFAHVLAERGARVTGVDRVDRSHAADLARVADMVHASVRTWAVTVDPFDAPDLVIDAIGHQSGTLDDAIRVVRQAGTVYAFGVPNEEYYALPVGPLLRKNLTLRSGITLNRERMLAEAANYLVEHPELAGIVTDVLSIAEAEAAFALAVAPTAGRLKIVLTP